MGGGAPVTPGAPEKKAAVARASSATQARVQAAAEQAGYAYHGYAQVKFAGIVDMLARGETIYPQGKRA